MYSTFNGHLVCCQFTVMKDVAKKPIVCVSCLVFKDFFGSIYLEMELLSHRDTYFQYYYRMPNCFSKWLLIYFSTYFI